MRWCTNLPGNRFLKNLNPTTTSWAISTHCTRCGWLETLRQSFWLDFNYLLGFECTKKLTSKTELSSSPRKSCRVLGRRPGARQLAVTPAQVGFQQQCCDNRLNTEGTCSSQWRCSLSVERSPVIVMLLTLRAHFSLDRVSFSQVSCGDFFLLQQHSASSTRHSRTWKKHRPSTMSWVYPQLDMSTANSNGHIWESFGFDAWIIPTGLKFGATCFQRAAH